MVAKPLPAVAQTEALIMSNTYRQVDSFESNNLTATGVGRQLIAFGMGNTVVTVAGSQRTTIDHGQRIIDIAVAEAILVLSPGTLTAYTLDGDQIWSQRIEGASAIAANPGIGYCGVLGDDNLQLVDLDTGRNQYTAERTRPGSSDDVFIATDKGFVYGTWSFLTGIDSDGQVLFDRNLSAVIKSVGYCSEIVVVALQNGRLVGLSDANADLEWRLELEPTHIGPNGRDSVLVSSNTGIHAVSAEGVSEPVPELPTGSVYATTSGEVVCMVRDSLISTYVHNRDRIRVDIRTTTIEVGGTVDIEVTNRSNEPQTAGLSVELNNCSFSPNERTVSLDAGETVLIDFPIASIHAEGEEKLSVAVDGKVTQDTQVTVEDAAAGTLAVETDLQPSSIIDGTCVLTVTVANKSSVTLDGVRLVESESDFTSIPPGESWNETLVRHYIPDRRVSVGLEVIRGDRRREYAPTCTLPPAPTIDVDAGHDAVRATVEVNDEVTVTDRLVVEIPGSGRFREPITIDGGELLLVVPQYDTGVARISFEEIDVENCIELSAPTQYDTSENEQSTPSQPSRTSGSVQSSQQPDQNQSERQLGNDNRKRSTSISSQSDQSLTASSDSASRQETESSGESSTESTTQRTESSNSYSEPSNTAGAIKSTLTLSRTAPEMITAVGHAVRDQLTISNAGETVSELIAIIDGEQINLNNLEPKETVSLARFVTTITDDALVLPAVEIEAEGSVVDQIPERKLPVKENGIGVCAIADPKDGTVTATVTNHCPQDCQVTKLSVGSKHSESVLTTLSTGESAEISANIDRKILSQASALPLSLGIRYANGSEDTLKILGVISAEFANTVGIDETLLSVSVGSETEVAGEYGSVILVFENNHDREVKDVSVAADGEPIDDMFYSEARRERLAAGDWIEHFIDIESGIQNPQFEATVSYTIEDITKEYTIEASGPAVDDESAWNDSHLNAWSIKHLSTPDTTDSKLPSTVSTGFRRVD